MGYRMHVHKKHVVEYADRTYFNWDSEAANGFLLELYGSMFACVPYSNNSEFPEYASYFEFFKEDWKMMIEKLKEEHDKDQGIAFGDYTYAEVINIMEEILMLSDPDKDVVYLEWF